MISSVTIDGRSTVAPRSGRHPFDRYCHSECSKKASPSAALNFYAESPDVFDDESVNLGLIFATHAALVWNMMRRDQQFRVALVSRDIIGQAKGRLMERFDIDAAEAFERLKQMSQDANTPIAQVAQRVTGGDSSLLK